MKLGDKFELKKFENQVRAYYDDPAIKERIKKYLVILKILQGR